MEWAPLEVENAPGRAGRDDPDNLLGPVAAQATTTAYEYPEETPEDIEGLDLGPLDSDAPSVLEAFDEHLHPRDRLGKFGFAAIKDVALDEPPTPKGRFSSGMVLHDDGGVWLFEPKGHFGGYEHTFPKGMVEKGLTPQQNAHKELFEETGLRAQITGHLGDYRGTTGVTRFYVAHRTGGEPLAPDHTPYVEGGRESASVKHVTPEAAERLLNMPRDKQVLADAAHVRESVFTETLHPRDRMGKWESKGWSAAAHKLAEPGDLDSLTLHSPGGTLTPERAALHKKIIREFLKGTTAQEHPKALFTAGGAASGKSSLIEKLDTPKGAVMVNPDLIKEKLPEYDRLREMGHADIAAAKVHEESSHIAAQIAAAAFKGRRHVIIDGVGDSGSRKFVGKIEAAHRAGHDTTVRYAHVPLQTAIEREEARRIKTGRAVPHSVLTNAHQQVAQRYHDEVRHMRHVKVEVYDTGVPKNAKGEVRAPRLIAEHRRGNLDVLDRQKYQEFSQKRSIAVEEAAVHTPPYEPRIPFDSADYLERKPVAYPDGKMKLDDGTVIDLNAPGPFDPPTMLHQTPGRAKHRHVQEAAVWHTEDHPRWPHGMGHRGGQFMRVGEHFMAEGKQWEISNIVKGHVIAHLAGGSKSNVATKAFEVAKHAEGHSYVPAAVEHVVPQVPTGGKHDKGTITVISPYVEKNHDPAIPLPAGSPITPDEWQRFGRLDQMVYSELQERFGKYQNATQTQAVVNASYAGYSQAAISAAEQAFSSQYGSSTGKTLSLAAGQIGDVPSEVRAEALAFIADHAAAVQWDLYNRTHSPDVTLVHKDSDHGTSWWQEKIAQKLPIFSTLSHAWGLSQNFGSVGIVTPIAIRHIAMSTQSAQLKQSKGSFIGEKEIATPFRYLPDDRSIVMQYGSTPGNAIKWLEGVTSANPVGGHIAEMFIDAVKHGSYLPTPVAPKDIQPDAAGGKTWPDPPNEAATLHIGGKAIDWPFGGQGNDKVDPANLPEGLKGLPWTTKDEHGHPVAETGEAAGVKVGQYFVGMQGTLYWVGPDPGMKSGYPFHIFKIVGDKFNGEDFAYDPSKPGYYIDHTWDITAWFDKQNKAPSFDPTAWGQSGDTKFLGEFVPGEKFVHNGTPYEVTSGEDSSGKLPVLDLLTGAKGKVNGNAKSTWLVGAGEAGAQGLGQVDMPVAATYDPGDLVKTPFGKAIVTAVEALPENGGQLVSVEHTAGQANGEFPAKELAAWPSLTAGLPTVGTTFAHNGKKAVVTKLLKNGDIQANLKPGKLVLTPEEFKQTHAHAAVAIPSLQMEGHKTKLGKMQVGDLFHGSAGVQTIRPYQIVHNDEVAKEVHVQNLDTGEVTKMSKNVGYRRLVPIALSPPPDEPKGAEPALTGGGGVGPAWDPAKFEHTGITQTAPEMAVGTYADGANGSVVLQKIADDGQETTMLNLSTLKMSKIANDLTPIQALATYKPLAQAGPGEGAASDPSNWTSTADNKMALGDAPDGTTFGGPGGGMNTIWEKVGGTDSVGNVNMKIVATTPQHVGDVGKETTLPPSVELSLAVPPGGEPSAKMTVMNMPVGMHYKTKDGAVIQKVGDDGHDMTLKMVAPTKSSGVKKGVTWQTSITPGHEAMQETLPHYDPVTGTSSLPPDSIETPAAPTAAAAPQATAFDPSSYIEGAKVKIGEMPGGTVFKTESKKGAAYYKLSDDGGSTTNLLTGKVYPAKANWSAAPLMEKTAPPSEPGAPGLPTEAEGWVETGATAKLADSPNGTIVKMGDVVYEKIGEQGTSLQEVKTLAHPKQENVGAITYKKGMGWWPVVQPKVAGAGQPEGLPGWPDVAPTKDMVAGERTMEDMPVGTFFGSKSALGTVFQKDSPTTFVIVYKGGAAYHDDNPAKLMQGAGNTFAVLKRPGGTPEGQVSPTDAAKYEPTGQTAQWSEVPVGTHMKLAAGDIYEKAGESGTDTSVKLIATSGANKAMIGKTFLVSSKGNSWPVVSSGAAPGAGFEPVHTNDLLPTKHKVGDTIAYATTKDQIKVGKIAKDVSHSTTQPAYQMADGDKVDHYSVESVFKPEPGTVGALKPGDTFKVPEGYFNAGTEYTVVPGNEWVGATGATGPGGYWTVKAKPVEGGGSTSIPAGLTFEPTATSHVEGTMLKSKADGVTPYEQLTKGDITPLGALKKGDRFMHDGTLWQVNKSAVAGGYGNPNAIVQEVLPGGGVSPYYASGGFVPDLAVHFDAKKDEPIPVPDVPFDEANLPTAHIAGFEGTGTGGVVFSTVGVLPYGTVFEDANGKKWKVKSAGANPIVSNGVENAAALGHVLVASTSQKGWPGSSAASFEDLAPPVPGEPPGDPVLADAKANLVPNAANSTLNDLHLKKGDYIQYIGQVWGIGEGGAPGFVDLINVATGKHAAVTYGLVPQKISPGHAVPPPDHVPSATQSEGTPAPSLFTHGVKATQLAVGDKFTLAPGSGHVYTAGTVGSEMAKYKGEHGEWHSAMGTVYVQPETAVPTPAAAKPADPATEPPVHTTEDMAPHQSVPPKSPSPHPDALQPFASHMGPGGVYKHPMLKQLQVGQMFTDKSGTDYQVIDQGPDSTIYRNVVTGDQFQAEHGQRVKLTALPPEPGSHVKPVLADLVAKYGSLEDVPKLSLQGVATTANGTGGKASNPRLGHLKYGDVAVDAAGHKVTFLASWLNRALVIDAASGETRLADAAVRVQKAPPG